MSLTAAPARQPWYLPRTSEHHPHCSITEHYFPQHTFLFFTIYSNKRAQFLPHFSESGVPFLAPPTVVENPSYNGSWWSSTFWRPAHASPKWSRVTRELLSLRQTVPLPVPTRDTLCLLTKLTAKNDMEAYLWACHKERAVAWGEGAAN